MIRTHAHTHTHKHGRIPLDEGSARRRDIYLKTQQFQERDVHASSVIRTRHPSKQAAVDQNLTPRVHWSLLFAVYSINLDYA